MNPDEDEWTPRSKCLGQSDMFELADPPDLPIDHPYYQSQFEDWVNVENRKFARAEETCIECPVFVACGKAATKQDREWTMRAGVYPTILTRAEAYPRYKCDKGHELSAAGELNPYCWKCVRQGTLRPYGTPGAPERRPTTKAGRAALAEKNKLLRAARKQQRSAAMVD